MIIHKQKSLYFVKDRMVGTCTECNIIVNLNEEDHYATSDDNQVDCPKCLHEMRLQTTEKYRVKDEPQGIWFVYGLTSGDETVPYPLFWSDDELEARRFSDKRMTHSMVTFWPKEKVWGWQEEEKINA